MPEKNIYGGSEKEYTSRPKDMPAFLSYEPPKKTYEPPKKPEPKLSVHPVLRHKPPKKVQVKEPKKVQVKEPKIITKKIETKEEPSWLRTPSVYSPSKIKAPFLETGGIVPTFAYHWQTNWPHALAEVEQGRKDWILPTDSWFEKKLKDTVITTIAGIKHTGHTIMQTGVSATLEPVAAVTAATVANGNDIFRTILGMKEYSDNQKAELMDNLYDSMVFGTLAYMESTAFGAQKIGPIARLPLKSEALFLSKKIPYEFNNAIKSVNKIFKGEKAKNRINVNSIKDMNDFVVKQAIVNPIVKKDIQALTIKTFEQQQVKQIGNVAANQIANKLRAGSGITVVAPLPSVGAAITPKELLPFEPLQTKVFINPLEQAVRGVHEVTPGNIEVKALKDALNVKRYDRSLILSGLDKKIAEFDASNVKVIPKSEVQAYLKENPIDITIDVGIEAGQGEKTKALKFNRANIERDEVSRFIDIKSQFNDMAFKAHNPRLQTIDNSKNFIEKQEKLQNVFKLINAPVSPKMSQAGQPFGNTNAGMLTHMSQNYMQKISEEGYALDVTPEHTFDKFESGDFLINKFLTKRETTSIDHLEDFRNKILFALDYHHTDFLGYKKIGTTNVPQLGQYIKLNSPPDVLAKKREWLNTVLNNWDNRVSPVYAEKHIPYRGDDFSKKPIQIKKIPEAIEEILGDSQVKMKLNFTPLELQNITKQILDMQLKDSMPIKVDQNSREVLGGILGDTANSIKASDIPEWPLFVDMTKSFVFASEGSGYTTPEPIINNYTHTKNNILENRKSIIELNKKIEAEIAKEEKIVPELLKQEQYVKGVPPQHIAQITFRQSPYGKYVELRGTTNQLTGYPEYRDGHFRSIPNMFGWSLNFIRNINEGQFKGMKTLSIEEIQPTHPLRATLAFKEGAPDTQTDSFGTYSWDDISGTPFYGTMTQEPITKRYKTQEVKAQKKTSTVFDEPMTFTKHNIIEGSESLEKILFQDGELRYPMAGDLSMVPERTRMANIEWLATQHDYAPASVDPDYFRHGFDKDMTRKFVLEKLTQHEKEMLDTYVKYRTELGEVVDVGNGIVIPTDEILFIDQPIYLVHNRQGELVGHYQTQSKMLSVSPHVEKLIPYDEVITNVEGANELKVREQGELPNYKSYDSVTQYLQAIEGQLQSNLEPGEIQKQMQKGNIGKADWNKKTLWIALRYAYDNNLPFVTIPTGTTMANKGATSGALYDNLVPIAKSLGFEVTSEYMADFGIELPKAEHYMVDKNRHRTPDEIQEWFFEKYGTDKINVIWLIDRELWIKERKKDMGKSEEILSVPQPVASLEQQTEQLFTFA